MTRFTHAFSVVALVAGAAVAQPPEALEGQPGPVLADVDGDGILNHDDVDFIRPGMGFGHGPREFVDADGDGINDLAPDADGDGIANHLDEDYARPGSAGMGMYGPQAFVDEDGDGINDLAPDADGDGIANHLDEDFVAGNGRSGAFAHGRHGTANGPGTFVDADGDGINDLAPDSDGDGIVNHLDDDYERPSGTGQARASGRGGHGGHARR